MRHEVKAATTILSTELSTEIVSKTKILFRNEGLEENYAVYSAMADSNNLVYPRDMTNVTNCKNLNHSTMSHSELP